MLERRGHGHSTKRRHLPPFLAFVLAGLASAGLAQDDWDDVPPGAGPIAKDPATPTPDEVSTQDTTGPGETDLRACFSCHGDKGVANHNPPKAKRCLTCHPETGEGVKGFHLALVPASAATCKGCHELPARTFGHMPVNAGMCTTCHDPHDTSARKGAHMKGAKDSEPCVMCHGRKDQHKFPHTAVALGKCWGCHAVHGSEQAHLLEGASPTEACKTCHPAQYAEVKNPHMPVTAGMCLSCHAPHGSDFEFNLVKRTDEVCATCHPAKNDHPFVHSAVALGECSGCHNPHGSDAPFKLWSKPEAGACYRCHYDDVTGREHPHPPAEKGDCGICHAPHGSGTKANLRQGTNLTCGQCHPAEYRPGAKRPHQAVEIYGCPACHNPHSSDFAFNLNKPINALCTTCHAGFDDGYHAAQRPAGGGHPMAGLPDPTREDRDLSCTSCHDPHGGEFPYLWYRAPTKTDLCNECHGKTL